MITLTFKKGNDGLVRMFVRYPDYIGGIVYAKDFQNKDRIKLADDLIKEC